MPPRTAQPGLAQALRDAQAARAGNHPAWRSVQSAVARIVRMQRCGSLAEDVEQLALLKLLRTESVAYARSDAEAFQYLAKVVRHIFFDALEREQRHHARRVEPTRVLLDQRERADPLETYAAPPAEDEDDGEAAQRELLASALDDVRAEVALQLEASGKPLAQRDLAWKQAEATLLARLGVDMDSSAIAVALGEPDASSDRIAKWVERGRPLVLSALLALIERSAHARVEKQRVELLRKLHARVEKRRADAGRARESRRKSRATPAAAQARRAAPAARRPRPVSRAFRWSSVQEMARKRRRARLHPMPHRARRPA